MDAVGQDVNHHRPVKKVCGSENIENGNDSDIISNLPECVLTHILSKLPTNYVVPTSVLSTKWKHLWTKVPSLYFDEKLFSSRNTKVSRKRFMNFVDSVILSHDSSSIQSFHLSCSHASRVKSWVSVILKSQVLQRLSIDYPAQDFTLPNSVFKSDTLTELNLNLHVCCKIEVAVCHFSNLKTLDLSGIRFESASCPASGEVSFTFPVLKVFKVEGTTWAKVNVLHLDAPVLDTFIMEQNLFDGTQNCLVKICSEKLRHFSCTCATQEIVLPQSESVVQASIDVNENWFDFVQNRTDLGRRLCNLLKLLHSVENLEISNEILEVLSYAGNLQTVLPIYCNLVHLGITGSWWPIHIFGEAIMTLLRNSPALESLVFHRGISHFDKVEDDVVLPECLLSRIKLVVFHRFEGNAVELDVAKFVLRNATALEKLIIVVHRELRLCSRKAAYKEAVNLSKFPMASRNAQVYCLT